MKFLYQLLGLLCFLIFLAAADDASADNNVANTQENSGQTQNTSVLNTMSGSSSDWGLTPEEWQHYQQLMKGRDGHWYPQLTPPEVLGLNAQNAEEQQHFAAIVAKEEHDKLARELAFDSAVHNALLSLYPNEPIIRPFDMSAYNPIKNSNVKNTQNTNDAVNLQSGDHLVLFQNIQQDSSIDFIPVLLRTLKNHTDIVLDIFCLTGDDLDKNNKRDKDKKDKENKKNDAEIQAWAKRHQLPVDLVNQGRITLNHDNGKFQQTAPTASLPYLLLVHNGNAKPINLSDLK